MMASKRLFLIAITVGCIICVLLCGCHATNKYRNAEVEDNEFAEFEDVEEETVGSSQQQSPSDNFEDDDDFEDDDAEDGTPNLQQPKAKVLADDDEATVEDDIDEFDDDDMFTNEEDDIFEGTPTKRQKPSAGKPELKIADVPHHLRTHWDSYYIEMLMIAGLVVYATNFLLGRSKNSQMANAWFNAHQDLLKANFSSVGDDGSGTEMVSDVVMKESEHQYSLWCSGRTCCEGMLVTIKMLKRQCLVNVIARILRPQYDQINIKVYLGPEDMDTFVFAVAQKKVINKLAKDMQDLSIFCSGEKKNADKFNLPSCFSLLSEIGDATNSILDGKITQALTKYQDFVDYIHVSDQYSGSKPPEENTPTKLPMTEKVIIFNFNVASKSSNPSEMMEAMGPMMQLAIYMMDKVRRVRLSREARQKADKNRQKVEEQFLKQTHAQRQEAAQQRREDKRRAEKERILNEEDPDKQRKLEEREHKREMKKRNPLKVKQLKVRAM